VHVRCAFSHPLLSRTGTPSWVMVPCMTSHLHIVHAAKEQPQASSDYTFLPVQAADIGNEQERLAVDVNIGLLREPKALPPRYFYDDQGSRYFQRIMDLPEYYLTDCEHEILERYAADILAFAEGRPLNLVDLGAGDGRKTMHLLRHLESAGVDFCFVPIDASEGAMETLCSFVRKEAPGVKTAGLVGDYFDGLHWLADRDTEHVTLALFLGSNIGNFDPSGARAFATHLCQALRPGDHVLMGIDLKKQPEVLVPAYKDSAGVTEAFNKNLLTRINRELHANFDLEAFRHYPIYNPFVGAMESYLLSTRAQTVRVERLHRSFSFAEWEPIHTESSYKFRIADTDALAASSGFETVAHFTDARGYFVDALWRVGDAAQ